jgi:nucleoside-diphosphate-sugar epimerase
VVFHIAWHWHRPDAPGAPQAATTAEQWHENVDGTELLIAAAKQAGVRRLVFTSTVWVYPASLPSPLREDGPTFTPETLRGHPAESYVAPKLAVEEMIRYLLPPPEYVILRPSLTYGVGARWAPDLIKGMLQGPPRRRVRPEHWVHVDDVARATILAAEVPQVSGMTFNVAGPETVASDQMRDAVQRLAARLMQAPASTEETAFPLITPRFDISMAQHYLGYRPEIGLSKGMEQMVAALLPELQAGNVLPPASPPPAGRWFGAPGRMARWGARQQGGPWRPR